MKIWLDDIRPAPAGFIHVRNLSEFQTLLDSRAETVEVMSFDHDLGDTEPTGYDIAKWLAENQLNRWPTVVKVHSANPPGKKNIEVFDEFVRKRLLV